MTEPRWLSDRENRVWRSYLAATRLLNQQLERELQRDSGLPLGYYELLVRLSEAPGRSQVHRLGEICDGVLDGLREGCPGEILPEPVPMVAGQLGHRVRAGARPGPARAHNVTAAAAATFSESTPPAIGIRTVRSQARTVGPASPSPSVPSTSASGLPT